MPGVESAERKAHGRDDPHLSGGVRRAKRLSDETPASLVAERQHVAAFAADVIGVAAVFEHAGVAVWASVHVCIRQHPPTVDSDGLGLVVRRSEQRHEAIFLEIAGDRIDVCARRVRRDRGRRVRRLRRARGRRKRPVTARMEVVLVEHLEVVRARRLPEDAEVVDHQLVCYREVERVEASDRVYADSRNAAFRPPERLQVGRERTFGVRRAVLPERVGEFRRCRDDVPGNHFRVERRVPDILLDPVDGSAEPRIVKVVGHDEAMPVVERGAVVVADLRRAGVEISHVIVLRIGTRRACLGRNLTGRASDAELAGRDGRVRDGRVFVLALITVAPASLPREDVHVCVVHGKDAHIGIATGPALRRAHVHLDAQLAVRERIVQRVEDDARATCRASIRERQGGIAFIENDDRRMLVRAIGADGTFVHVAKEGVRAAVVEEWHKPAVDDRPARIHGRGVVCAAAGKLLVGRQPVPCRRTKGHQAVAGAVRRRLVPNVRRGDRRGRRANGKVVPVDAVGSFRRKCEREDQRELNNNGFS